MFPTCKYTKGYKYQLEEDYVQRTDIKPKTCGMIHFAKLDIDGTLTIKKGYAWDGPSGPSFDTKSFMRGSLVHDALYQIMTENKLLRSHQPEADLILKEVCLQDGMSRFRAWYVYKAVRLFGRKHINEKVIFSAP